MAANAYIDADDLPRELQVDLLIDGELPEERRRALLTALDQDPEKAAWRDVALRFLQQQTEKQSVRALMAGGNLVPVDMAAAGPAKTRRTVIGRIGWRWMSGVAAGLLIAAISAVVTLLLARAPGGTGTVTGAMAEFEMALPPDLLASDKPVAVSVPMVRTVSNAAVFPRNEDNGRPGRTSVVVQPDGKGAFMVVPVNTSKAAVY